MSLYTTTSDILDALRTVLLGIDPNISGTIPSTIHRITAVSQANPAVVTSEAHGRATGDYVEISKVEGMTQLNGNGYTVTVIDQDTFSLNGIDSTGHSAYISGGRWSPRTAGSITAVSQAYPPVVTSEAHGQTSGDYVEIDSVVGMTELNGKGFSITVIDQDTFSLNGVDSTGYSAYVSGGTWTWKVKPAVNAYISPDDVYPQYRVNYGELPIWFLAQNLSVSEPWKHASAGTIDRHFNLELMLILLDGTLDNDEQVAQAERLKEPWAYATIEHLHRNMNLGYSNLIVGPMNPLSDDFAAPVFGKIIMNTRDYWGMYIDLAATQRVAMEIRR